MYVFNLYKYSERPLFTINNGEAFKVNQIVKTVKLLMLYILQYVNHVWNSMID